MNLKQFWIGLIDEKNDGRFKWESGLMLNSDVESYWANNQPKNMIGVGRRVCTHVNAQGKMNDITCGSGNNHAVCQKDMQGTIGPRLHQSPPFSKGSWERCRDDCIFSSLPDIPRKKVEY